MTRKAFYVRCRRISDAWHVHAATCRNAAIAGSMSSARDAGYQVNYIDFQARRAPKFDAWAAIQTVSHGVDAEYVAQLLTTPAPAGAITEREHVGRPDPAAKRPETRNLERGKRDGD